MTYRALETFNVKPATDAYLGTFVSPSLGVQRIRHLLWNVTYKPGWEIVAYENPPGHAYSPGKTPRSSSPPPCRTATRRTDRSS